ncbi:MAG: recombinase family protein [Erythrobacter sp.]
MKQCFGYVRVSTVKQSDGFSLSEQKAAISEYAARKNLSICKWWEETETAAKQGRPVFNEMVAALRKGAADGLITHKIDRSARNYHDWATISDLADNGVGIHISTENFDFETYGGRMAADFMAVVSANYVRNLRNEIHKGQRGQVKAGLYPWGAPIGYLNNGKGQIKTPDPKRAPFVRMAFELYASEDYSIDSLRHELNRRGFRNRAGKPLSMCGIETLLKNKFYCGLIEMKTWGQTFKGAHEPLVSVALFKRVQKIKSDRTSKKFTRHMHMFQGLFRCGVCDRPMVPERQKGHCYYRCHERGCATKTMREEALDQAMLAHLQHLKFSDEDIERAKMKIEATVDEYHGLEVDQTVPLELGNVRAKLERLTDALIDRLIEKDEFEARRAKFMLEEAELQERADRNRSFARKAAEVRSMVELAKSLATTYLFANRSEKRRIIRLTMSNRRVTGKNVEIKPSNWLLKVEEAIAILSCADAPGTHRTFIEEFDIVVPTELIS